MRFLFLLLIVFGGLRVQAQIDTVSYLGSQPAFNRDIFKYLAAHHGLYEGPEQVDSIREEDKFFRADFTIDAKGQVARDVLVKAYNDTSNSKVIAAAILSTSGKWINATGSIKKATVLIHYIGTKDDLVHKTLIKIPPSYLHAEKSSTGQSLGTIVIRLDPPVRKG